MTRLFFEIRSSQYTSLSLSHVRKKQKNAELRVNFPLPCVPISICLSTEDGYLVVTAAFHELEFKVSNTHDGTFYSSALTQLSVDTHITQCTCEFQYGFM